MKTLLFFVCLFVHVFPYSSPAEVRRIAAISTELEGDIYAASSDDSNDRLTSIKIYDESNTLRAEKSCGLSMNCSINLSSLPSGTYRAKVYSEHDLFEENIYLN